MGVQVVSVQLKSVQVVSVELMSVQLIGVQRVSVQSASECATINSNSRCVSEPALRFGFNRLQAGCSGAEAWGGAAR